MRNDPIELYGAYRYATRDALDRALADARDELEEDELATIDGGWLRAFVRAGTTLSVIATLPLEADRFVAAAVLAALARRAIDGVVEARRAGRAIDFFPCGG
jgi:hypothetical protein